MPVLLMRESNSVRTPCRMHARHTGCRLMVMRTPGALSRYPGLESSCRFSILGNVNSFHVTPINQPYTLPYVAIAEWLNGSQRSRDRLCSVVQVCITLNLCKAVYKRSYNKDLFTPCVRKKNYLYFYSTTRTF